MNIELLDTKMETMSENLQMSGLQLVAPMMKNPLYLVFLDIDGVFTSKRVQMASAFNNRDMWNTFDPVAIEFMNRLHHAYSVKFVLMSTWKGCLEGDLDTMLVHWMIAAFRNAGFEGQWSNFFRTNPSGKGKYGSRGAEVKEYLDFYAEEHEDFIMFDDNDDFFEQAIGRRRLIKTSSEDGLTSKHMQNALAMVGNWKKK